MRSALLNVMVQAATKAGRSLAKDFGEVENLQVSVKGPADFVSNADKRAEQIVFEELQKARPTYSFLGEEGTEVKGTDGQHRWIVDPLDGTTNFLHGIPMFACAIALERNNEIVASVIYNPAMEELFTAEKGGGAWLNDRKRLRVANRKHLADLAWLAAGRFDGYWEAGLAPWDVAPGWLMLREAGGTMSDYAGTPGSIWNGQVIAGNETIQGQLLKIVKAVN